MLGSHRLTYMDYASFERAMSLCQGVFEAWDDSIKEFTNVAREVTRKRSERFMPIKINPDHASLQERVVYLRGFRKQHHQLQVMVGPLGNETKRIGDGTERSVGIADIDMDAEVGSFSSCHFFPLPAYTFFHSLQVRQAYESVKNVDVLDVSTGPSPHSPPKNVPPYPPN